MKNKESVFYLAFLVLLMVVAVIAPAHNNITTLAVADSEKVSIKLYSKLEIKTDSGTYFLTPYRITSDRKVANFVFTSDPQSGKYFQQYFKLDRGGKTISMFRQAEEIYVYPERSKTIIIGEEKIYIELESIKNKVANLIIRVE